jgi:hypothetical protein
MMLTLTRDQYLSDCTLGVLEVNGKKFYTIERPWLPDPVGHAGRKYRSCICEGVFMLEPYPRPSGEKAFIVSNPLLDVYRFPADVPRGREENTRTLILIHAANYAWDVIGCIGPGLQRVKTNNGRDWMVTDTREAMNQIRTLLNSTYNLTLTIQGSSTIEGAGGRSGGAGASGNF